MASRLPSRLSARVLAKRVVRVEIAQAQSGVPRAPRPILPSGRRRPSSGERPCVERHRRRVEIQRQWLLMGVTRQWPQVSRVNPGVAAALERDRAVSGWRDAIGDQCATVAAVMRTLGQESPAWTGASVALCCHAIPEESKMCVRPSVFPSLSRGFSALTLSVRPSGETSTDVPKKSALCGSGARSVADRLQLPLVARRNT